MHEVLALSTLRRQELRRMSIIELDKKRLFDLTNAAMSGSNFWWSQKRLRIGWRNLVDDHFKFHLISLFLCDRTNHNVCNGLCWFGINSFNWMFILFFMDMLRPRYNWSIHVYSTVVNYWCALGTRIYPSSSRASVAKNLEEWYFFRIGFSFFPSIHYLLYEL